MGTADVRSAIIVAKNLLYCVSERPQGCTTNRGNYFTEYMEDKTSTASSSFNTAYIQFPVLSSVKKNLPYYNSHYNMYPFCLL